MKIGLINPLNRVSNIKFGAQSAVRDAGSVSLRQQDRDVFKSKSANSLLDKFGSDATELEKTVLLDKVCRQGKRIGMPTDWKKVMYYTAKYVSGKSSCAEFVSGFLTTRVGSLLLNDVNKHSYILDMNKHYPKEMKFLDDVTEAYKYCFDDEDYFNKADADNILVSSALKYLS